MRSTRRLGILVLGSSLLASLAHQTRANDFFTLAPTSYVVSPTSFVEANSSSWITPTTYVFPSAFVLPTSAIVSPSFVTTSFLLNSPSAFVSPTVYVPAVQTTFVRRRRLFARTFAVPTLVYTPTVFALPSPTFTTVMESPVTASFLEPCDGVELASPTFRREPNGSMKSSPRLDASTQPNEPIRTPATLDSEPAGPAAAAETAPAGKTKFRDTVAPLSSNSGTLDSSVPTPPEKPAPDKDVVEVPEPPVPATPISPKSSAPGPDAAAKDKATANPKPAPPVAPGTEPLIVLPAPGNDPTIRRDAKKPVLSSAPITLRTAKKGNLNILEGKVISSETGRGEEGVRVTISNQLQPSNDRQVLTNAYGRYAVRLPDGEWTVNVTMPSGRQYAVSELIVSQGQIHDDLGREIPSLIINR